MTSPHLTLSGGMYSAVPAPQHCRPPGCVPVRGCRPGVSRLDAPGSAQCLPYWWPPPGPRFPRGLGAGRRPPDASRHVTSRHVACHASSGPAPPPGPRTSSAADVLEVARFLQLPSAAETMCLSVCRALRRVARRTVSRQNW